MRVNEGVYMRIMVYEDVYRAVKDCMKVCGCKSLQSLMSIRYLNPGYPV